ncbi:MAG TPA: DMT family transporter [Kineosporiaceae bacterium]|nr:DMT family transporter [Kineosporiaceae bacterium]
MSAPRPRPGAASLALVAVTAVWGSTFPVIKDAVSQLPAPDFLAVRFAVASVALLLLFGRQALALDADMRRRALLLGACYGIAQLLQTVGLQRTPAAVAGFVTGMYVVLTPVLGAVVLRHRTPAATWLAVLLATGGLGVLSLHGLSVGDGELLVLASAALYAVHILGLGHWSTSRSALGMAVWQMLAITGVCALGSLPGGLTLPGRPGEWWAVVYTAIGGAAVALLLQTWAQAQLPATRAAVIMTMEPVFAAGFAVALAGEQLSARTVAGGGLVLAAMLLAELAPRRTGTADRQPPAELLHHEA